VLTFLTAGHSHTSISQVATQGFDTCSQNCEKQLRVSSCLSA